MSFEQDIVAASEVLHKLHNSGMSCTDTQLENGIKLIQQRGLNEVLKYEIIMLKNLRFQQIIEDQKAKILELEQKKPASTIMVIPDEDEKDKNT